MMFFGVSQRCGELPRIVNLKFSTNTNVYAAAADARAGLTGLVRGWRSRVNCTVLIPFSSSGELLPDAVLKTKPGD
jgi:hypothetical protein